MKNKKQTSEYSCNYENWSEPTYRTGSTQPPKSKGGIIALLLVLVIFLSGISTVLGLMNIRLFQKLNAISETTPSPVVFSRDAVSQRPVSAVEFPLGFAGQEVTAFWQTYHDLPSGIYVVEVTDTDIKDLLPGDVLTQMDSIPLSSTEELQKLLQDYTNGDCVPVVLYRNGTEISTTLTIKNIEED